MQTKHNTSRLIKIKNGIITKQKYYEKIIYCLS